jgi:hypothetical protein
LAATTIFQQKAHRLKGQNPVFLILAIVCMLMIIVAMKFGIQRAYIMAAPGAGFMIMWRSSASRTEDIIFFVNKDGNEFYFSYKDEDLQRLEDVRIDEYKYWYYVTNQSGGKQLYHLIFTIETTGNLYCLKEKIERDTPPPGWEYDNKQMPDQKDVLLIPNLQDLATFIDSNSEVIERI